MRKIRTLSLLLAAMLLFTAIPVFTLPSSAAGESPLRLFMLDEYNDILDPETGVEGVNGDTFTVKIKASGVNATCTVHGFQFRLAYDAARLCPEEEATSIYLDDEFATILFKDGYIEFIWTSTGGTRISKSGKVIAEATFTMIKGGTSDLALVADASEDDSFYRVDMDGEGSIEMIDYPLNGISSGQITTCCSVPVTAAVNAERDFCFALNSEPTPINEQVKIGISMHNPPADIYGFSLEVNYDPAKLAYASGELDAAFPFGRIVSSEEGRVRVFSATDISAPVSATCGLAVLAFTVVDPDKAVGSSYDLSISFYNGQPAYTRVDHQTVPYPTVDALGATVTLTESRADPFDLNVDGEVAVADVSLLLDYIAGAATLSEWVDPDLDRDGSVAVADVSRLLDYVANGEGPEKNGLYDENGGVRLYENGVALKRFQTVGGRRVYFDPSGALMVRTDRRINGILYIAEAFVYGYRVLYAMREAKNGFYTEDGGLRYYTDEVYATGWTVFGEGQVWFNPDTGLMETRPKFTVDGVLYVTEPASYEGQTLYFAREARVGLFEEDGGIRCYAEDEMQTGFATVGGYRLYFDPQTGLMRSDALFVDGEEYLAPTAVSYDGLTVYAYGDPLDEPAVNTAAWAEYISVRGDSLRCPDSRLPAGDLYMIGHTGATGNSPWENYGGRQFRFLITFDTDVFPIGFSGESPYTWYIWYKDTDDTDGGWSLCVTKPDSLYRMSGSSYLFRVPTYAGGMTDLHTDNGARNDYEFVILIYRDSDSSLICYSDNKNIPVTDAYEMTLNDALTNGSDLGGEVTPLEGVNYELPETGVLGLAPDGEAPGVRDGRNPRIEDKKMTVFFDFFRTGAGLDLADGTVVNYSITRANGSVVTGSSPVDTTFEPTRTANGYIGLRFNVDTTLNFYETISYDLSFTDRNGKTYTVTDKSFTVDLPFLGLGERAFAELISKGIDVTVNEKSILFEGRVGANDYTLTLQLDKWAGNTTASQIVTCVNLFFDVYPPMFERFGAAGGSPTSVTLAVENEGYGIASTGGNFVHIHDMWLHNHPNDYDCLTHEFAHVIQYGWDGNYCEVSGYIEMFADCCRFLYATENGRYNDLGWSIGSPGDNSTHTNTVRFLVWMDYTYSTEDNDLLLKFFTACKNKQYRSNRWAQAWTWIFAGSGLAGKTASEAFDIFKNSEFASLSTRADFGVSPLNARYDVRAKAGREAKVYALYFPLCNSKGYASYAATWTATLAGQKWTLEKFSNNANNWNFVKCGTTAGGSARIYTTIPSEIASFAIDLGDVKTASVTGMTLNVYSGATLLTALPLQIKAGRQTVTVPEEYRAEGLTYEFAFVTGPSSAAGVIQVDHIIAHTPAFEKGDEFYTEPEINTAAWAAYIAEAGVSAAYDDFELKNASLYQVTHNGASEQSPWENGGSPNQLQFLPVLGKGVFDIDFVSNAYPYTWHIWYKDLDDPDDEFKVCLTEPWSEYDWGNTIIYRVPTYRDGMTDLHTDNGARNEYKFVIVVTDDATGELVCWFQYNVGVTDSYEMFRAQQDI